MVRDPLSIFTSSARFPRHNYKERRVVVPALELREPNFEETVAALDRTAMTVVLKPRAIVPSSDDLPMGLLTARRCMA